MVVQEERLLVRRLLEEVGGRPDLDPEEERALARAVADGLEARARLERDGQLDAAARAELEERIRRGTEAKRRLVAAHLPLVVRMLHRYRWSGLPVLDLFQEGTLALLRAAERFDWRRGTPFGAYAAWWVRHALSRAVRQHVGAVRLPEAKRRQLRSLAEARAERPWASWEEIAERAELSADDAAALAPLLGGPVPLEAPTGADSDRTLEDLLADREAEEELEEVLVEAEVERLIRAAERVLSPREREVLEARYGLGGRRPETLREVGERLGVSLQRVAQIEAAALAKLRRALGVEAS
ncbi:MAG TPA: sigma-70 family RNA polymerase sigma factor [Actinomycetota bacterium]|nr:sigma-70 family RNA polymerase sigma factor [Actinomycetota bacterium]